MSPLEALQTCPLHRISLLSTLGLVDPNSYTVARFEIHKVQPFFPYHVEFIVHVECINNIIKCTVIDDETVTYVMSLLVGNSFSHPCCQNI